MNKAMKKSIHVGATGRSPLLPRTLQRIVVVRALHLGDLLNAVPALRSLRKAFPFAEITLISLPWAREDFAGRLPYVDRFLEFPGYPGIPEVDLYWPRTETFIEEAQRYGYDLAIQLHGDGSASNAFTALLGAKCSVGYQHPSHQTKAGQAQVTYTFPYPDGEHEIVRNLKLMRHLGIATVGTYMEFPLLDRDYEDLEAIPELAALSDSERIVGLHLGAGAPARRWLPERFAAVGDAIVRDYGARVVLTGAPGEEAIGAEVQDWMQEEAINLVGKTTIGSLAALIRRMSFLVTNDTGPSHLSAALGTPSVILFGAADPKRWAPLDRHLHPIIYTGEACSPCLNWDCPVDGHPCMSQIRAQDVLREAQPFLGDNIWHGSLAQKA